MLLAPLALAASTVLASQDPAPKILPLRERAAVVDHWLERRLDHVVPYIMRAERVDVWIVLAREYAEDPVVETMLPATWMSARRRTILVFHDPGEGRPVERMAVARYDVGRFFETAWDKETQPDQFARVAELVRSFEPARIALNVDPVFALGDGLTASQCEALLSALGEDAAKVTFNHHLPIRWLETRIVDELETYPSIVALAHRLIAEGFSSDVVRPGRTTTTDLEWWFRERIAEWKLDTWFHPTVSLQRREGAEHAGSFASKQGERTIQRGDLLHVDIGITYLRLNTDTQQHAYVLHEGETDAPDDLKRALRIGNRAQDVLMGSFRERRSGNSILASALERCAAEGIDATIYTHPLGYHGHGAGPTIGLWDQQDGVPGRGDYPLHADTAHSIELNVAVPIPAWDGQVVRIMLEEDAVFDGEACRFLDGRQTEFLLIR